MEFGLRSSGGVGVGGGGGVGVGVGVVAPVVGNGSAIVPPPRNGSVKKVSANFIEAWASLLINPVKGGKKKMVSYRFHCNSDSLEMFFWLMH